MARMTLDEISKDNYVQSKMPDLGKDFEVRAEALQKLSEAIDHLYTAFDSVADTKSFEEYAMRVLEAFDMLTAHFGSEVRRLNADLQNVKELSDYVRMKDIGALEE